MVKDLGPLPGTLDHTPSQWDRATRRPEPCTADGESWATAGVLQSRCVVLPDRNPRRKGQPHECSPLRVELLAQGFLVSSNCKVGLDDAASWPTIVALRIVRDGRESLSITLVRECCGSTTNSEIESLDCLVNSCFVKAFMMTLAWHSLWRSQRHRSF